MRRAVICCLTVVLSFSAYLEGQAKQTSAPGAVPKAIEGRLGQWVKGRQVEIRVNVQDDAGLEIPQIDLKNHGKQKLPTCPSFLRLEYRDGTIVEDKDACSGPVIAPGNSLTGFLSFRPKRAPKRGEIQSVEVVLGKKPEFDPERFLFRRDPARK